MHLDVHEATALRCRAAQMLKRATLASGQLQTEMRAIAAEYARLAHHQTRPSLDDPERGDAAESKGPVQGG